MQRGGLGRGLRLLLGAVQQILRFRVPVAGTFDGADPLPHENARRVEALEQPGVERVLGAHRVGADRLQLAHQSVLVAAAQRVAVAQRVLLQGGAVQPQAPAVEVHAP